MHRCEKKLMNEGEFTSDEDDSDNDIDYFDDDNAMDTEDDVYNRDDATAMSTPIKLKESEMWVIVLYKGERFLGKVHHKKEGKVYVLCLEKPSGINVPQTFEKDGVY